MAPSKQTSQAQAGRNGEVEDGRGTATNGEGLDEMARRKGIEKPSYTQTPNILFDELMRDMSEAELKVTLAVMRQTFGWHRHFYEMSLTDLQEMTGMSRPSVVKGADAGIRRGVIRRRQDADGIFYYGLVVNDADDNDGNDYPLVKKPKSPSKKSLPVEPNASKEFLPATSKESLLVEAFASKNSLPLLVKNFNQERQELDEEKPLLKKVKERTTKERTTKERSSSSISSSSGSPLGAEKSKNDDDDDLILKSVLTAWDEGMPEKATDHIQKRLKDLIAECGPAAVIGGILAAADASGRSFKYVATCARNLVAGGHEPPRKTGYRDYVGEAPPADEDRLAWRAAMTRAKLAQEGDVS